MEWHGSGWKFFVERHQKTQNGHTGATGIPTGDIVEQCRGGGWLAKLRRALLANATDPGKLKPMTHFRFISVAVSIVLALTSTSAGHFP